MALRGGLVRRALDQVQPGVGGPGAFLGHGEADRQAFVDQVPGAHVEMRADHRFAALVGIGGRTRTVEVQRRVQRGELGVERGQVGRIHRPDARQEEHERHARGIGGRGQATAPAYSPPQVLPAGRRLLDLARVVDDAQRVIAGADRIGGPVLRYTPWSITFFRFGMAAGSSVSSTPACSASSLMPPSSQATSMVGAAFCCWSLASVVVEVPTSGDTCTPVAWV